MRDGKPERIQKVRNYYGFPVVTRNPVVRWRCFWSPSYAMQRFGRQQVVGMAEAVTDPRGTLKKGVAVGRGPAPTRPPAPAPRPPERGHDGIPTHLATCPTHLLGGRSSTGKRFRYGCVLAPGHEPPHVMHCIVGVGS